MDYLQQLTTRYPSLHGTRDKIKKAYDIIAEGFEGKGKLLVAGNGGSAADAEHIVGELMKGFVKRRKAPEEFLAKLRAIDAGLGGEIGENLQGGLPAIALPCHTALTSACTNDIGGDSIYAQQVYGYGAAGDVFLGISTSGNAKNILYAMITAKAMGMKTIALSGGTGGSIAKYADAAVIVPETETFKVQELHLPIYHTLCLMVEDHFFS